MAIKEDCNRRYCRVQQRSAVGFVLICCVALSTFFASTPFIGSSAYAEELVSSKKKSPSLRDALFNELAADADRFEKQFGIVKRVVRLVRPSIVHINAQGEGDSADAVDEAGSGIILQMGGTNYVLTNRHVVDKTALKNVNIHLEDGQQLSLVKSWSDPGTDMAVIEIGNQDLLPARLGDSNKVEIGDFVLAVGSPFGLSHSVSYGIVSAKGRWDLALGQSAVRFQDFLQTDAAINPGNSGGPLLNLKGEVIGINTAIASNSGGNEGIGFSIPINLAVHVASQLIREGSVSMAYLGVRLDHSFTSKLGSSPELSTRLGLKRTKGAMIKGVTPQSPADDARLRPGDVVTEFNGHQVEDDDHLVNLVSLTPINEVVSLSIIRNRQPYIVQIRVGRRRDYE